MNFREIIRKKQHGQKLSKEEIEYWIGGVCNDTIAQY